jgi:uncharacterized membrane protein YgdD (TMEM256/DUF423 family)
MSGWSWIRIAAVVGFLAVALGAFGAHSLSATLESHHTTEIYKTAAHYHMDHALALAAVGLLGVTGRQGRSLSIAGWGFLAGIVLFSGSLYVLAVTGWKLLGMITPFGGVAFLIGWVALAIAAGKTRAAGSD